MTNYYEVVLGPAAETYLMSLAMPGRATLAGCLRVELRRGPNCRSAFHFMWDNIHSYTALPLTYNGIVVVYRSLTTNEIDRLRKERRLRAAVFSGYLVVDFLSPESAIYLRSAL